MFYFKNNFAKIVSMFYILSLLLFLSIPAFSYDINDLIKEAERQIEQEKSQVLFKKAVNAVIDGAYSIALKSAEEYLKHNEGLTKEKEIAYEILGISYYNLAIDKKIENAKPYINKMNNLLRKVYYTPISRDAKLRLFILANNLFLRKKQIKKLEILNNNYKYLLRKKTFYIEDKKFSSFDPNVNIFKIEEGSLFGRNEVYISDKDQTLVEIAKKLDMGYDEMRLANKYINPNDIRKGEAVFVPRRRLIPEKDFKFWEIYINLSEKRLYYPVKINGEGYVISIPVGIGTDENKSPIGDFKITEKKKNPEWVVPESIREERPDLPKVVPPGPDNPLGTRAMRLGNTSYLMHGTSKKFGIGMKVSHGCIRMYNKDVERIFEVVNKGTKVHITEKDFKLYNDKKVFIEVYSLSEKDKIEILKNLSEKGIFINKDLLKYVGEERKGFATPLN